MARHLRRPLLGALASIALPLAAYDLSWKGIQFGGFVSQGYLLSSANDYLGDTSEGTFDFREYAARASWSHGKLRLGAQAFGQKLGSYGDDKIKLDWGMVDYQFIQWFGLRAGRVKMPRGLYNEALDVDAVRPFVLLPQSLYDNRLRDFNASFDGGMIYGNVPVKRLGSFDYTFYYGDTPMTTKSGASDFFNTDTPFKNIAIGIKSLVGGTFFWNTPITGLRAGYSHTTYNHLNALRHIVIPQARRDVIAPKDAKTFNHDEISLEYIWGDWTFATEAAREKARYSVSNVVPLFLNYKSDLFYVSAARRINTWLEIGSYYSVSREHYTHNTNAVVPPLLEQEDYALSTKFDLNDHLIFKIEGHYLEGAGKIFDTASQPNPIAQRDTTWMMIAAKMTYTF